MIKELDYQMLARARAIYDEIASEDKALSEAFLPLITEILPLDELIPEPPILRPDDCAA